METNDNTLTLIDRFNTWIQESMTIKLISIGFLVLVLLIPTVWIEELIRERESRSGSTIDEISKKWSGRQTVSGPVLVVPFTRWQKTENSAKAIATTEHAFFLADELMVDGDVKPEELSRGIFDVVVYQSTLRIGSTFRMPDFEALNIPAEDVHWRDVYFALSVTDLRGISDNPKFMVGTTALAPEPASDCGLTLARPAEPAQKSETSVRYDHYTTGGVIARPEWTGANDFNGKVNITLSLKGSKSLQFIPSGKTTTVRLGGSWSSPSFDGDFIPINRSVDDSTFTATWKVSHFNRPFSQQWIGKQQQLGSSFGVNLLIPVDQYQKSMRTAKYGIMIILLTFIAMFMVEIIRKIRIHPFQYILIGAALIVYYTLLLSLSEHFGYNLSYAIASASTIILISLYSSTFLHSGKLTLLFTLILSVFYGFIFVIIQEQDYSLLLGSVGLFIIIATLMFFSRNIDWYTPRTGTAKR